MNRYLVTVVVAVAALGALAPTVNATGPRSGAERAFLTEMINHHAMAVEEAEMAQERAVHPELKAMADDIVRSQSAEIKKMQSWLRRWYGVTAKPKLSKEDTAMMQELEGSATPAEFEVRFMALMTMHHTQAIERAVAVRKRRIHPQTRRLAAEIIKAQDREIEQMRTLLVTWYANPSPVPPATP